MHTFLRWWFIICLVLLGCGVAQYYGLFVLLWQVDQTKLSFFTLGLFAVISLFIGHLAWVGRADDTLIKPHLDLCWLVSEILMGLGMLGTLIGFLILLHSAVSTTVGSSSDFVAIQKMISAMSIGFSTSATTTIVGLATSLLVKLEMVNLEYLVKKNEA